MSQARVVGLAGMTLCMALSACTLSRPQYEQFDGRVGDPAFVRAVEAHTLSGLVEGNRAAVLLNGDEIFPAMLAAIRGARTTITFATFLYEQGAIAHEFAARLTAIFEDDLRFTRQVPLADWQRRSAGLLLYLPLIPLRDQL